MFSAWLGLAQLGMLQLGAVFEASTPPAAAGIDDAGGVWWWQNDGVPLPPGASLDDLSE